MIPVENSRVLGSSPRQANNRCSFASSLFGRPQHSAIHAIVMEASRVIMPILPIIWRKLMQRYRPMIMVISTLYIFIYILHTLSISKKSADDDLNSTTRNGHADYAWKYEATFVTRNTRQERGRNAAHVRPLASRKIAHVNRQLFSASTSTAAVSCTSRPFNWAVQSPAFKTPA